MKYLHKVSVLILFVAVLSGIVVYAIPPKDPHDFKKSQCGFCHINFDGTLQFRDNITTLCNYCHGKDRALSHIVGIKPSMEMPQDFHLDKDGVLTCGTCHDIHMSRIDAATSNRTYLLRRNVSGRQFCNVCHNDPDEIVDTKRTSTHANLMDSAHFGYYTSEYYSIDKVSLLCIGCHEGGTGAGVPVITKKSHPIGEGHRIGMNYTKVQRKKAGLLRSPRALSSEIMMFGGRVGCTSCHNPFKLGKHQLNISNEESKLCLECHLT